VFITSVGPKSAPEADPDTGNTVDMKVFIHKLHMGSSLPSVQAGGHYQIVGFNNSVADFSTVVFPANGGPLACAVARAALRVLVEERLAERSAELGAWLLDELGGLDHSHIREIRGRGLLAGLELTVPARPYCERLKELGVLCKETHDFVIRLAPPLVISKEDLAWMVERLREAFAT